ncbi:DUF4249 domain-containing protein [Flagellimonas myxillae]|uniref:DUF4249 domain-containing protein n=1 Tax=Flagellimonas myxillae TaxID=2942214 RepID=UPI00201EEB61|nr:DUF4249 domain-containing protein [Muricauda myxillae]MCL6265773.1 DUF4249 domain-containing protein [Muricauda myxillae]
MLVAPRDLGTLFAFGVMLTSSCVEPFEVDSGEFLSALVVDATITDEMGRQSVYLSYTYNFEEEPEGATGALVKVVENGTNEILFTESAPGVFRSQQEFAALPGNSYKLEIVTGDGSSYSSQSNELPQPVELDSVYAARITSNLGEEGIAIFVDSFDATGNAQNFRYEYQETYKIIAPEWNDFDLLSTGVDCGVDVIPKTTQNRICFATNYSNEIILTTTADLNESRVQRFMVRFMDDNNYIISHRYSIEVTQYTQSNDAASYYSSLDQISSSESIFSESQPGFLVGNVVADGDPNEKVLGYFEVSSVSKKRIFFDYEDFYPGADLPDYVNPCLAIAPKLISQGGARCVLSAMVEANQVSYLNVNDDPPFEEGPYLVVPRECGDCTVLGSNTAPEFWTE